MDTHLRIRVSVFLCLLFAHCGSSTDSNVKSRVTNGKHQQRAKPVSEKHQQKVKPVTEKRQQSVRPYNLTEILIRREEFRQKYVRNGTGTLAKDFVDSLTRNSSEWRKRRYTRRIYKTLSKERLQFLYEVLPKYVYSKEKLELERGKEIILEIGFGSGDHFIHQAKMRPEAFLLGIETFLNGIASALRLAANQNVTNFLMYPNDLEYVFKDLPDSIFTTVYLLFPDPWECESEKKQEKRRMVNEDFVEILRTKLIDRGRFVFATDIDQYFDDVLRLFVTNDKFEILNRHLYSQEPEDYLKTRYHEKAITEGRRAQFLICRLVK